MTQVLPSPIEIIRKDSSAIVGFACPACGVLQTVAKGDKPDDIERKRVDASSHCVKNCVCGAPLGHYRLRCRACLDIIEAEKEARWFAKATKVTIEDYDGALYLAGWSGDVGDGYFSDIEALLDYCEQEGRDVPDYAWACALEPFKLDAETILEREIEQQDFFEHAGDRIPPAARANLQAYLTAWTAELKLSAWHADYSRAVVLNEERAPSTS